MYIVYVLHSEKTGRYYYGHTGQFDDRIRRHNAGEEKATRHGRPWRVIGWVVVADKNEAAALEARFKRFKNPARVIGYIRNHGELTPLGSVR